MGTGYEHLLYGRGSSRFPHIDIVRWESRLAWTFLIDCDSDFDPGRNTRSTARCKAATRSGKGCASTRAKSRIWKGAWTGSSLRPTPWRSQESCPATK